MCVGAGRGRVPGWADASQRRFSDVKKATQHAENARRNHIPTVCDQYFHQNNEFVQYFHQNERLILEPKWLFLVLMGCRSCLAFKP